MTRLPVALAVLLASALLGASAAWAASLVITPQKLTVFAYCIVRISNADSDVNQSSPGNNNATSVDLYVRSSSGGNRHTFVKFDLASCNARTSAVVTTATLSLHMSSAPGSGRTYQARRVTGTPAWTEAGITWTNQPAVGAVTSTTTTGTTSGVRRTWSVTADAQAWLAGTAANYGLRISDAIQNDAASLEAKFVSKETGTANQRPQLTIMYYPQ